MATFVRCEGIFNADAAYPVTHQRSVQRLENLDAFRVLNYSEEWRVLILADDTAGNSHVIAEFMTGGDDTAQEFFDTASRLRDDLLLNTSSENGSAIFSVDVRSGQIYSETPGGSQPGA